MLAFFVQGTTNIPRCIALYCTSSLTHLGECWQPSAEKKIHVKKATRQLMPKREYEEERCGLKG